MSKMMYQTQSGSNAILNFESIPERITSQWPAFNFADHFDKHPDLSNSDAHSTAETIAASTHHFFAPQRRAQSSSFWCRLKRICIRFPVKDPSWLTSSSFTIGSAVFVINGFFILLPDVRPGTDFKGEGTYAAPVTSVLGTFIFLLGGWTAVLEVQNMGRGGEIEGIGFEIEQMKHTTKKDEENNMTKRTKQNNNPPNTPSGPAIFEHISAPQATTAEPAMIGDYNFIWVPSIHELLGKYMRDPMFIGALIQMIGAIIFSIATITAVPGVMDLENTILLYTLNLLPTLVGGVCFLIAAIIQTVMAQDKWYIPTPWRLEWHVGFWNAVGSMGFSLAGALPYIGTEKVAFQATLSDFWGSWAFMLGSAVQWYIVMGNYP